MNLRRTILWITVAAGLAGGRRGWADDATNDTAETIKALKKQVEELDQKVRILERKEELATEATEAKANQLPAITVGAEGVNIRSSDTNFAIALHGLVQLDSRTFFHDQAINGNDSFILRRARPILQGTVYRDFDFMFVPDFGGSTVQIQDVYLNYRFSPELQVQAGKFKSPVGLEQLQYDPSTSFNERSLATDLVPNRDVGVELHGDVAGGVVSYGAGIFNAAPDYTSTTTNADFQNNKSFAGRLFVQPLKNSSIKELQGLGFGLGSSYEVDRATTNSASTALTPGFTTDGQQKFFSYASGVVGNGTHWRLSPQGYYYYGPFGLLAEFVDTEQWVRNAKNQSAELQNSAWEISGGWVLTGENASYVGVIPSHPFDPMNGHWGAFQVVGRYAELDVDKTTFPNFASSATSASSAQAWSVGLNWYLNRDIRFSTSFSQTVFTGGTGTGATVTRHPESVLFTRIQLAF
jgi:phosphate-selective porin OprO/OprP